MKLKQWSLAGLMLAAAGCGSNTDNTTVVDNGTADTDGGSSGGNASGGNAGATGATGATGVSGGSDTGGSNDGSCKEYVVRNEQVTPDILIVLDRSGSMNASQNGGTDRWTGSRNAIIASTKAYNDQISFGLMAFPDDGQCGAQQVAVNIKPNAAPDIESALTPMTADGSTPTAAAVKRAHEVIGKGMISVDGLTKPKVMLLVTDGAPTCGAGGGAAALPPECTGSIFAFASMACRDALAASAGNPELVKAVVDEITAMAGEGTRTFVIGFQTSGTNFAGNLDQMAAAGGTALKTHTSVSSEQELSGVLQSMISNAVSCTFGLETAPPNASYVLVSVDGEQLNLDQPDGWKLGADGKTVEVQGKACAKLQSGAGQHTLNVEVKCDVVPII